MTGGINQGSIIKTGGEDGGSVNVINAKGSFKIKQTNKKKTGSKKNTQ